MMVLTMEEIKSRDSDDASFDQLVKKVEEAAIGDEKSIPKTLTQSVVEYFVKMKYEKAMQRALRDKEETKPPTNDKRCLFNDVDDSKKKKKRPKEMDYGNGPGLEPLPNIPEEFRNLIEGVNGTDIVLVIQKQLTETDMNPKQNRFSVPRRQVRTEFLTEEEKQKADLKEEIEVLMIQPCLEQTTGVKFTKWDMRNTFSYCLIGKWSAAIVNNTRNQLKVGSLVQLWSFRIPEESSCKLGFVLVNLSMAEKTCSDD